ncbi:MAG: hypothetical protein NUV77_15525 [Thermoguttaceae bacterium]|jgi:hypothetical protein|nr:hypothetical protein [Thermoguttaceae bacterium]
MPHSKLFLSSLLFFALPVCASVAAPADGTTIKAVLSTAQAGENLLKPGRFGRYEQGFERQGNAFVCDNGGDARARRGVSQVVELNQTRPEPIVATAWSKAEGVTGSPGPDYSIYLDLVYDDGTQLWGQSASFSTGTHDWHQRKVVVLPEKPVKRVSFYLLLRGHGGKAYFKDPELRVVKTPEGAARFDGVPVVRRHAPVEGFQVRDVAAGGDFVRIEKQALGLEMQCRSTEQGGDRFFDVTLTDTSGKDRAVTLVYAVPVAHASSLWLDDPRRATPVAAGGEYMTTGRFHAGGGRLSRYPLGAVARGSQGTALGIDMMSPAFFRVGYNAGTEELFLAYDLGLAPEKPSARVRFCRFAFDPAWGFRAALARYYELFADHFRCRTPEQGLWMPFAKISRVKGWEDFGFKFKEGNDETAWDDAHGIITFRYTEPMTWWMTMPKEMPRTLEAALAEARRLAEKGRREAKALLTSGYHNAQGEFPARLLDTPWCNGAVWSMNSMPGIAGDVTDFKNKWNPEIRESLYGPKRRGDLDGEYVDSSEGYVTDELDFRREHFAAAQTPLCFSPETHRPAIFRGLVAFEYVRGIERDIHPMGKLMMANGAPTQLPWLCPMLDVLGTETDWNHGGRWSPMSDADLLYRRALCKGKPYCFLMNTEFEKFGPELVEKYMKRSLAYGMFPGFFSHNASQGHYFTRPELYDRDRPLFKKYVPLCKLVAEAGWTPLTRARSSEAKVYVERFGEGTPRYLTVFNDSAQRRTTTISLEGPAPAQSRELVRGGQVSWNAGKTTITLDGEDVAVIELK